MLACWAKGLERGWRRGWGPEGARGGRLRDEFCGSATVRGVAGVLGSDLHGRGLDKISGHLLGPTSIFCTPQASFAPHMHLLQLVHRPHTNTQRCGPHASLACCRHLITQLHQAPVHQPHRNSTVMTSHTFLTLPKLPLQRCRH